jgi:hypothetical protein
VLIACVLVFALVVVGGAFLLLVSKSSSSSPSSQASIVAVVPTHPVTPTVLITPKPKGGILTGQITSEAGSAAGDIGVILCSMTALNCTTDSHLTALSDETGSFEIDNIPAGSYAVLYSETGAVPSSDYNLTVNVNDKSAACIGEALMGSGNISPSCDTSVPFAQDDPDTKVLPHFSVSLSGSGSSLESGAIYSPLYGLALNFEGGEPLTVDMVAGSTNEVSFVVHSAV